MHAPSCARCCSQGCPQHSWGSTAGVPGTHLESRPHRPQEVVHKRPLEHVDVHYAALYLYRYDVVRLRHRLEGRVHKRLVCKDRGAPRFELRRRTRSEGNRARARMLLSALNRAQGAQLS